SEKNGKPYAQSDRIGSESRPNLSISWRQLHAMLTDYSPLDVALATEREAAANGSVFQLSTDGAALVRPGYWEIIADNLHNTGWSLGRASGVNREGRAI